MTRTTFALALWIGMSSTALWAQEVLQDQIKQDIEKLTQLAAEDNYDAAQLKAVQDKLMPVIDQPWARPYRDQFIKVRKDSQEYAALKPSLQKLLSDPDNAEANSRVARYHLFVKEDWTKALPYLAKGQDKNLKEAATAEQTGDPKELFKAANIYIRQAKEAPAAQRNLYTKHVLDIANGLSGDQKKAIEADAARLGLNPQWQSQWSLNDQEWSKVKLFRTKAYLYVEDQLNYETAKAWCTKHKGSLVMIKDSEENTFVQKLRPEPPAAIWLGGGWSTNDNHNNVWLDGSNLKYSDWYKGSNEPNNTGGNESKISMLKNGHWNDAPGKEGYSFVCEWKISP